MWVWLFVFWLLCGIAAGKISEGKGRSAGKGFLVGFLLGPIGVVLALVDKPDQAALEKAALKDGSQRKCPSCAELVKREATICRHCQRPLPIEA